MQIVIDLTADEASALALVTPDPGAWAGNLLRERARQALDAAVDEEIGYLAAHGEPIPRTRSDVLASALRSGRAKPAAMPGTMPALPMG